MSTKMTPHPSTLSNCPECDLAWEYMAECYKCKGTGVNQDTGEKCVSHSSCKHDDYPHGMPDYAKDRQCGAHCCKEGKTGPFSRLIGVQYSYEMPEHYDGVSEYMCPGCETRWGRWTGNTLKTGEVEPRFGGEN